MPPHDPPISEDADLPRIWDLAEGIAYVSAFADTDWCALARDARTLTELLQARCETKPLELAKPAF
jgi:hypothetical protein